MELGNFLGKLKGKVEEHPESFLALVLTNNLVQSAVWQVAEGKTEIISLGTPVEWDGNTATTNELVQAVDATISSATEGLPTDPSKIIFGLANSWVDQSGILGSKKDLLKSICKDLELKALGYVVLSDCILKYLKMQEGNPATSILIQVAKQDITLSLVKLGRIEASTSITPTGHIAEDVSQALSSFKGNDPLPSRFIVISSMENTSELVQELTSFDWAEVHEFLHTPKIEALPKDVEVHATAVAGGTEVATSLGFVYEPPTTQVEAEVSPDTTNEADTLESEDLDLPSSEIEPELLSAEEVGFSTGIPSSEPVDRNTEEVDIDNVEEISIKPKTKFQLPSFAIPKFRFNISLPSSMNKKFFLYLLIPAVLVLGVFVALYTVPKAQLSILIKAKPLETTLDLTLSESAESPNVDSKILPVTRSSESITGTKTIPTTGTKLVGEVATGSVTIYNRTTLSKNFLKGTSLSSGNLKFVLDDDVTVASKSAGADYVDVPGKATVKISAKDIGSSSNLSAGSEFTLATFGKDSYVAKNDEPLSGGSSKEITTFSEADKKDLVSSLQSELIEELKSKVTSTNSQGFIVLDQEIEVTDSQYSAKVGEEATEVGGTLTFNIPVLSYQFKDIESLVSSSLNTSIPQGYVQTNLNPTINFETKSTAKDEDPTVTARVSTYVLPVINTTQLAKDVVGKSPSTLPSILSRIPGYLSYDLALTPRFLPPRLQVMPRSSKNIVITTTPSL